MTETRRYYPENLAQIVRLDTHPRISAGFALDKGLWDGRKVAVRCITRGTPHRRTTARIYYGTLVLNAGEEAGKPGRIGVRFPDGEVALLHKNRAVDVYDLTRKAARR